MSRLISPFPLFQVISNERIHKPLILFIIFYMSQQALRRCFHQIEH